MTEKEERMIIDKAVETAATALLIAMELTNNPNFIESEIYTEANKEGIKYKLEFRKQN